MQNIIKESLNRNNGNGAGAINARGIPHRGWTPEQRVTAAVDAVLGTTHVVPTIGQAARDFYVSPGGVEGPRQGPGDRRDAHERRGGGDHRLRRRRHTRQHRC